MTDYLPLIESIQLFEQLPSTNNWLIQYAEDSSACLANQLVACLAEKQTAGRGRHGKTWLSPYASNIYLSLLWYAPLEAHRLTGFSLVVAVAIVKTLNEYGISAGLHIKWPNDILWSQQKLSGCLIDVCPQKNRLSPVVIGVGLNVHMPKVDSSTLQSPWTDLNSILNTKVDRSQLAGKLINHLIDSLHRFQHHGLQDFQSDWQQWDIARDRAIVIQTLTGRSFHGIGQGIDQYGRLLLQTLDGQTHRFVCGEVSLRFAAEPHNKL